jgi:hypothetical protein
MVIGGNMKITIDIDSEEILTDSEVTLDMLEEVIDYMKTDGKSLSEILIEVAKIYDEK